jgi:hypothetical protein
MRRASFVVAAVLAGTLTACGSTGSTGSSGGSGSGSGHSSKAAASPASSTPPTATSPSSTSATTSPSSPSAPAECRTADLKVSLGSPQGAAGSTYSPLRLTNTSGRPCRTGGFGGVSLVKQPQGNPIGSPAQRTSRAQARQIVLHPGDRAHATLRVVHAENYPPAKCRPVPAAGFRVYPPNETRSAFVRQATTACRSTTVDLLSLSPYRKG